MTKNESLTEESFNPWFNGYGELKYDGNNGNIRIANVSILGLMDMGN